MKKRGKLSRITSSGPHWVGMMALLLTGMAQGADQPLSEEQTLRQQIIEQTKRFEALKRQIADMDARLLDMQARLDREKLRSTRGTGSSEPRGNDGAFDLAQASQPRSQPETVGQPDNRPRQQQVAQIFEQPGVLTPRGKLTLEPGLQYGYSSSNRISLVGYSSRPKSTCSAATDKLPIEQRNTPTEQVTVVSFMLPPDQYAIPGYGLIRIPVSQMP